MTAMAVDRLWAGLATRADAKNLLDALATGVVLLDAELRVLHANVAAQDLMAVGLNQARGRRWSELFIEENPVRDLLDRARSARSATQEFDLALRPVGSPREARTVDLIVTPLETLGEAMQYLIELIDAEPRARLSREQALRARLESSRLMTRQLAHEVKNPLGGLRGAAQLLERELPDPAMREYTGLIIREADRLTTLIDQMLGPARPPRRARLNLHEVCEHVYHLLRAEAPRGVSIERDYDPSLPDGHFDRDQLVQALLNVARNAMQAVGPRGRVVLRTRAVPQARIGLVRHRLAVRIDVLDDGPGVPDALRATLFYPLVTSRAEGAGLGLAVSQELITRHGGLIEFDSEPGRTVFSLHLPLDDGAAGGRV